MWRPLRRTYFGMSELCMRRGSSRAYFRSRLGGSVWWPVASASLSAVVVQDDVAEWRQQAVEQRDWGVRIDGGALPEGFLPPGLERGGQFFAHPLRGVGVQAAHPGNLVSQPLLGEDLGNAVFG